MSPRHFRLGELCELQSGGTPSRTVLGHFGGTIPWAKIADLDQSDGVVIHTDETLTPSGLAAIGNRLYPAGTVLLAMYGSVGKVAVAGVPMTFNQAILGLRPRDPLLLDASYLRRWLASRKRKFTAEAVGVTQKNLAAGRVAELGLSLPPLAEQRRIAAILDKADAIRRKRQQAIQLPDDLLRSAFLDMFGDPVTNPKGWNTALLGDRLSYLTSGSRGWAKHYSESGRLFLRIQNVGHNNLLLDDIAHVGPPDTAEARRTLVEAGDVLLSITADLGRTAVVPGGLGVAHINQHLALLRPSGLEPHYLSAFLASAGGQSQLLRLNRQGVKAGLNFDDIRSLHIPVPPVTLQQSFGRLQRRVEELQRRVTNVLIEADSMFSGLMQHAFRGDLLRGATT